MNGAMEDLLREGPYAPLPGKPAPAHRGRAGTTGDDRQGAVTSAAQEDRGPGRAGQRGGRGDRRGRGRRDRARPGHHRADSGAHRRLRTDPGGQCPGGTEPGHPDRDRLQCPVSPGHELDLPERHAAVPIRVHPACPCSGHALGAGTGALERRHHQVPRTADLRADRLQPSPVGQRGNPGILPELHRSPGHR